MSRFSRTAFAFMLAAACAVPAMAADATGGDGGQRAMRQQRGIARLQGLRERRALARRARLRVRAFERLDVDRNGVVTRQEWRRNARLFDRLDRNHDGGISKEEMVRPGRRRHRV